MSGGRFDAGATWRVDTPATNDTTQTFEVPAAPAVGASDREVEWVAIVDEAPGVKLTVKIKRLAT
ncbi:MAG: hypothetical protein AAGF11_20650 [Myxococcota bacterium]